MEQVKEARRMRKISALVTGFLVALNRDRDAQSTEERRRLRVLEEMRENRHSLSATKAQSKETGETFRGQ